MATRRTCAPAGPVICRPAPATTNSAYVAALPVRYTVEQMAAYKSGARKGSGSMTTIAKSITRDEIDAAADYFAALKPRKWIRVVETDTVPKTYVGPGNKRLRLPDGGSEPIGNRIIEIPENEAGRTQSRSAAGFCRLRAQGQRRQRQGAGGGRRRQDRCVRRLPRADLQGLGDVPPITGRQATYVVRQLFIMQNGDRSGPSVALMQQVVKDLTIDDMLALAAYTASREP